MERVAFLIEKTGHRIGCLLNPESLTIQRTAGVRLRDSSTGPLAGASLSDNPLLYTGGGATEMTLDLLFDTTLAATPNTTSDDVRTLTSPLWSLAENQEDADGTGQAPLVRFIWGRTWNIPGVVTAVAERFEYFTEAGIPRRSWLRMRFVRVNVESAPAPSRIATVPDIESVLPVAAESAGPEPPPDLNRTVEITGGAPEDEGIGVASPSRLDVLAQQYFNDPALWRLIAWYNSISDPLHIEMGRLLRIPPRPQRGSD
jgi:hypothetical protein